MKRTPRNNAHLNIVAPQVLKDAVQTAAKRQRICPWGLIGGAQA
jgi:hypothetical protein